MSETKRFKHLYFTFFAAIGSMSASAYDALDDAAKDAAFEKANQVQKAAYEKMKLALPGIEGYRVPYNDGDVAYDVEQFELCEDDVLLEERCGRMCFGLGFFTEQRLSEESIAHVRRAVERVYAEASAEFGQPVALVGMERQVSEELTTTSLDAF